MLECIVFSIHSEQESSTSHRRNYCARKEASRYLLDILYSLPYREKSRCCTNK